MLSWTVSKAGGPKRVCHAAVAVRNKLYSFGGHCDEWMTYNHMEQMEVHVFNMVSLCWKKLTAVKPGGGRRHLEVPSMHCGHTAVLTEDTVYIWGGYWQTEYDNVLYAFDVDAHRWFKPRVSGTVPEERYDHSACVLEKVMFIHGGETKLAGRANDVYKLDTSTMVWSLINTRGTQPPASRCHSVTIIGTKMFVFGGYNGQGVYNRIRVFDTETNDWMITPSPQPGRRFLHSAFTYKGEQYIFSGLNDVWKFSPETISWKNVKPKGKGPCPMYAHDPHNGMGCCIVGERIVLFGGKKGDNSVSDELFVLDMSPSLKTLCKMAVIQYALDQSELPHDITWELAAMTKT